MKRFQQSPRRGRQTLTYGEKRVGLLGSGAGGQGGAAACGAGASTRSSTVVHVQEFRGQESIGRLVRWKGCWQPFAETEHVTAELVACLPRA